MAGNYSGYFSRQAGFSCDQPHRARWISVFFLASAIMAAQSAWSAPGDPTIEEVVADLSASAGGNFRFERRCNGTTGFFEGALVNITTGEDAFVQESSTPCADTGGGDGDTGNEDTGNDAGIVTQAAQQIDGALPVTNPEVIDGDVFNPFGVNLSAGLFGLALERANDESEDEGAPGRACDKCKEELAALEQELDAVIAKIAGAQNNLDIEERRRERSRQILLLRGGVGQGDDIGSLSEAGRAFGLSEEQIQSALAAAGTEESLQEIDAEIKSVEEKLEESQEKFAEAAEIQNKKNIEIEKLLRIIDENPPEVTRRSTLDKFEDVPEFVGRSIFSVLDGGFSIVTVATPNSTRIAAVDKLVELNFSILPGNNNIDSDELFKQKKELLKAVLLSTQISAARDLERFGHKNEDEFVRALGSQKTRLEDEFKRLTGEPPLIVQFRRALINQLDSTPLPGSITEEEFQALDERRRQLGAQFEKKQAECRGVCSKATGSSASLDSSLGATFATTLGAQGGAYHAPGGFTVSAHEHAFFARFDLAGARDSQAYNRGGTLGGIDPRLNVFASVNAGFGSNDGDGVDQDSVSIGVSGGASYLVAPALNVGVALRYGQAEIEDTGSDLDTRTFGLAAFAQTRLDPVTLEGIAAWSRSDVDGAVAPGVAASSSTNVFSGQIRASSSFALDRLTLTPSASLTYVSTDRDAFALSTGQVAPGEGDDLFIIGLGAAASTVVEMPEAGLRFTPSLGFSGAGRTGGSDNGLSLGLSGGLGVEGRNGIKGNIGVGYSGLGGDAHNLSVSAGLSIPLN